MPVKNCNQNGKQGYKWGDSGKCYTYSTNNETERKQAKQKAIEQGLAITGGKLTEQNKDNRMKKIKTVHLIKNKDLIEEFSDHFNDVKEENIDSSNFTIKNVCVFGTRFSKNNRIYQDSAIESLTKLASGARCYINHPTKAEVKERDGVRDLRDWVGVYFNPRKMEDKVYADLRVREGYFDLVKDIATLKPHGIGNSINARVKVFQDEKTGLENITDMDSLRSVDLVSSAATTSSLFESALEDQPESELVILHDLAETFIKNSFDKKIIEEGIIKDAIDNRLIQREINDVTWIANDLIDKIIYNNTLSISDKKEKVVQVFNDLSMEIDNRMKQLKENFEEDENMELTLEMVKANSDIVESLFAEFKNKMKTEEIKENFDNLKKEFDELKKTVEEKDEMIKKLETEKKELEESKKTIEIELDKFQVEKKMLEKKSMVDGLIKEAKLGSDYITDIFMNQLLAVEEKKDGEKVITAEDQIKEMIEDRKKITEKTKGKVTDNGDEFVEEKVEEEDEKAKEVKVTESDIDEFAKKLKK